MAYPTYEISGLKLDDPAGRWNLVRGTALLPSLPGLAQASYKVPGAAGHTVMAHAPLEPATRRIAMQFHAMRPDGSHTSDISEATALLNKHISDFYTGIRHGAAVHEGLLEVTYHISPTVSRVTWGRIVGSTDPAMEANDYASLEFILEIPSARWYSPEWDYTAANILGGTTVIQVPCGDAPMDTMEINVNGYAYLTRTQPLIFTNPSGHGFRLETILREGDDWMLIKPRVWGVSSYISTEPQWNLPIQKTGALWPQNRPQGSGLALYPSADPGFADVEVTTPGGIEIHFRTRKAWF